MPKYTPGVERIRARQVSKSFIKSGMNASAIARQRGTTPQNEAKKIRRQPVQDALQEYINSPKLKAKLIAVSNEGLSAKCYTKKGIKPDHDARHKYWHDLCQAGGILKLNGEGGVKIINIIHAYRKENNADRT